MSVNNLGMVRPGSTIIIPFSAFTSDDPAASVIISDFVLADIGIYKGTSMDERGSTTGVVLLDTDGINIDGATGIHGFTIDLSSNATADFYTCGSFFYVTIGPITIDGATINFVAATFSIGQMGAVHNTTIATLASQTSFTLTDGPAEDDAFNGYGVFIQDIASAIQVSCGYVLNYTGSSKTVTLKVDPAVYTFAAADHISFFMPTLVPTILGNTLDVAATGEAGLNLNNTTGTLDAAQFGADFITAAKVAPGAIAKGDQLTGLNDLSAAQVNTEADAALADVNLDHLVGTATAIPTIVSGTYIDQMQDDGTAVYSRATDSLQAIRDNQAAAAPTVGAIADQVWEEAQADHVSAGSFGVIASEIAAIPTTAMRGTDSAGTATNLATVDTVVDAIKVATDKLVFTVANQVDANVVAVGGSSTAADKLEEGAEALVIGEVNDASASTTAFVIQVTGDTISSVDDFYNGRIITFTSGNLLQQSTDITDYVGSSKTVTVTALTAAPNDDSQFVIS